MSRLKTSITGNNSPDDKIIADFTYSKVVLDTIFIKNLSFDCSDEVIGNFSDVELCGLVINHFSQVIIKNSFYEKNINVSIPVVNDSSLVIENCTFLHNDIFRGVIFGWMSVIHITNSVFENNIRSEWGTISMQMYSVVIVRSSTFNNNQVLRYGGGVSVTLNSTLVISNSIFTNNRALGGGAIFVSDNSTLDISGSLFFGNYAYLYGGAVLVADNCSVICRSSTFFNNGGPPSVQGSAMCLISSNITLSRLIITQNHGHCALSFYGNPYTNTSNSRFYKNIGGAMCFFRAIESTVWNCDFWGNKGDTGAVISADYSELITVSNVRCMSNVVTHTGGAISTLYTNSH